MIVHLKENISIEDAENISRDIEGKLIFNEKNKLIITSSKKNSISDILEKFISDKLILKSDIQLASRDYIKKTRKVKINNIEIGGNTNNTLMITGPCSIESKEQIRESANLLKKLNLTTLRAGCFKPRTSPYSFQGLGVEGLKMLSEIRDEFGFNIISSN